MRGDIEVGRGAKNKSEEPESWQSVMGAGGGFEILQG